LAASSAATSERSKWQSALHGVPNQAVINIVVSVRDDVSQADDATKLGDLRGYLDIEPGELGRQFADNFQLTLHAGSQQVIRLIVGKVFTWTNLSMRSAAREMS
jgi:hypothetical protein